MKACRYRTRPLRHLAAQTGCFKAAQAAVQLPFLSHAMDICHPEAQSSLTPFHNPHSGFGVQRGRRLPQATESLKEKSTKFLLEAAEKHTERLVFLVDSGSAVCGILGSFLLLPLNFGGFSRRSPRCLDLFLPLPLLLCSTATSSGKGTPPRQKSARPPKYAATHGGVSVDCTGGRSHTLALACQLQGRTFDA